MKPVAFFAPLLLILNLLACGTPNRHAADSEVTGARDTLRSAFTSLWPSPGMSVRTTHPDIYIRNLDASIDALESLRLRQSEPPRMAALAERLYLRFRITGSLDDLEQAIAISQSQVDRPDASASDWMTQARLLSGIHRFEDAAEAIDRAERMGAAADQVEWLREQLARATGHSDDAPSDDLLVASRQALDQGHAALAISLIQQYERELMTTDPSVLSWSLLQQGVILLEHDLIEEANQVFEAAHQRLPQFYLATEHLAETEALLGHHQRAVALYRQVIEQNDLPLFHWQLSLALDALGQHDLSRQHLTQARTGYQGLLESWPDTFNDHAIDFYLENEEPKKALQLARQQLGLQSTIANRVVLAETALINDDRAEACAQWSIIEHSGHRSFAVLKLADAVSGLCP